TFLLGVAAAVPATAVVILSSWASIRSPWVAAAVGAFVVTAVPEELLKLLVIRGHSARQSVFRGRTDGLVYGIAAALGFGALENALYAIQGGWVTAILRAVTAVPMNAATGAILGYSVALSRLAPEDRRSAWKGLTAAIVLHGIYDFSLLGSALVAEVDTAPGASRILFPAAACAVLVGTVGWVIHAARRLRGEEDVVRLVSEPPSQD
ncbi:MAG: PrsW family glutamic-type intramembrane protease, partial [Candidatus Bipolaricaulis sp.]|nr:PrsW family glutamic-type intramembrane protease [Candidatus Bipolaricaulis sp.]